MSYVPVVVVGCGYVGTRLLGRTPNADGWAVSRSQAPSPSRWVGVDLDADPLDAVMDLCGGAQVYYFAPPSATSQQDDRSRRFVAALAQAKVKPTALVLISTTGVYGDCAGQWVDENWPLKPTAARSVRRVDMEEVWTAYAMAASVPLAILRVAGIYGPGKLPLARLSKQQPLLEQQQSPYSNRVHTDDLIDTAMAAMGQQLVVNVADGAPSTMTAYFHALADAAKKPRLAEASREQLAAEWSDGLASYMSESRRIDNSRMRALLGASLRYPDLAAGLAASLAEQPEGCRAL